MSSDLSELEDERVQVQKAQEGDAGALGWLRKRFHPILTNILLSRGGNRTEVEDLLADLWADCVPGGEERASILEKFSGKCTFQGWLSTVATNRLIDLKRKQQRRGELSVPEQEEGATTFINRLPAGPASDHEGSLVQLLRQSLQQAFASCSAEGLLMLRLVYLHGLSQREVARMWGCHEATISRTVAQTMSAIEKNTLRELKKQDPWLELTFEDFLDLCRSQQMGFL